MNKYAEVLQSNWVVVMGPVRKDKQARKIPQSKMGKAFLLQGLAWAGENMWDRKYRYVPGMSLEAQA